MLRIGRFEKFVLHFGGFPLTKITIVTLLLMQVGSDLKIKCFEGVQDDRLVKSASVHAAWMAAHQKQGHQNWDARKVKIQRALGPGWNVEEVCAESWPGQGKLDAAKEMFHSWKQSPGHWAAINQPGGRYGFAMALGENGVWFGCGQIAREK